MVIDSAQQASNIAVSVSNLIKTWSNIPFGLGLVLAFAQAATIVAFMANIRNQAKAISGQKFRHGGSGYVTENGLIVGPSHQAGGVHFEAEGGEIVQVGDDGGRRRLSIVKRERVRDYFDLLDAANRNDKDAMREHALNLAGPESDYTLPYMSVGEGITPEKVEIDRGAMQKHLFGESGKEPQDNRQIEELRRSNQLLEKMLRVMLAEKDREQWTPDGKTRIRGNIRTTFIN